MALNLPPRRNEMPRTDPALSIVNLVLLLIFFFMLAGQATSPPVPDLTISSTSGLPLQQLPKPILTIRSADEWQLDGNPVSPELIPAAVAGPVLHVMIDRAAPAGLLIEVLRNPVLTGYDLRLVTRSDAAAP